MSISEHPNIKAVEKALDCPIEEHILANAFGRLIQHADITPDMIPPVMPMTEERPGVLCTRIGLINLAPDASPIMIEIIYDASRVWANVDMASHSVADNGAAFREAYSTHQSIEESMATVEEILTASFGGIAPRTKLHRIAMGLTTEPEVVIAQHATAIFEPNDEDRADALMREVLDGFDPTSSDDDA